MESLTLSAPYMVRVAIPDLNIRRGSGTDFPKRDKFTGVGIFTIIEEKDGWGLLKAYAEKRDGWISLAFTTRILGEMIHKRRGICLCIISADIP